MLAYLQQGVEQPKDSLTEEDDRFKNKPNIIQSLINVCWQIYNTRNYSDFMYEYFVKTMEDYKYNRVPIRDINYYKLMGLPEPDQYIAFINFYKIFSTDHFAGLPKTFTNNARLPRNFGTLELLNDFIDNYKNEPIKHIIISCGSFFEKYLWVRREIIDCLNNLYEKGVNIEIYTNCEKDGKEVNNLNEGIHFEHLDKRVMIHFMQVDEKYLYFYLPHSESIYQRLSIFLKPKDFENNTELREKKKELFQYFNNLIEEAKNNN